MKRCVPEIIVISLKSDKERRRYVSDMMRNLNIEFSFFDAVEPNNIPSNIYKYFYDEKGKAWGSELYNGEIGCYASHLSIMKKIVNGDLPNILFVAEDDFVLKEENLNIISDIYSLLIKYNDRIDYINLYQHGPRAAIEKINTHYRSIDIIRNYLPSYRTHSYFITIDGCNKFLSYRSKRTVPIDLDIILSSIEHNMLVWEVSRTVVPYNESFERSSSIYTGKDRAMNRGDVFLLNYRRSLAKKKYGMVNDIKYMTSRKIWKLRRKLSEGR